MKLTTHGNISTLHKRTTHDSDLYRPLCNALVHAKRENLKQCDYTCIHVHVWTYTTNTSSTRVRVSGFRQCTHIYVLTSENVLRHFEYHQAALMWLALLVMCSLYCQSAQVGQKPCHEPHAMQYIDHTDAADSSSVIHSSRL